MLRNIRVCSRLPAAIAMGGKQWWILCWDTCGPDRALKCTAGVAGDSGGHAVAGFVRSPTWAAPPARPQKVVCKGQGSVLQHLGRGKPGRRCLSAFTGSLAADAQLFATDRCMLQIAQTLNPNSYTVANCKLHHHQQMSVQFF